MAIKILLFDTCAILKFFIDEPGSDTVRYMVRNRVLLGLNISVATIARLEFENDL
jgi:PIN domain nuclease of toxin-antitoxin system